MGIWRDEANIEAMSVGEKILPGYRHGQYPVRLIERYGPRPMLGATVSRALRKKELERRHLVRNLERLRFVQLKRDLLRQHDVAYSKAAFRHETQHANALAALVELFDVHLHAVADAVKPTAVAT
jgi:hypothetical protein